MKMIEKSEFGIHLFYGSVNLYHHYQEYPRFQIYWRLKGYYLVRVEHLDSDIGFYTDFAWFSIHRETYGCLINQSFDIKQITHWMPLPKPPTKDK